MSVPESTSLRIRIGELSRRTGVGKDTLRAWERRYGLLRPERSEGGFRLYGGEDVRRVQAMKSLIASGVSAGEAARLAASGAPSPAQIGPEAGGARPDGIAIRLRDALARFDEAGANALLDEALSRLTLDGVAGQIVLPVMREIGERWQRGEMSIAQEHFATGVLRERMLGLGRNWGAGVGPLALLACPPGERHDLGLVVFGLILCDRGWRITYLGPDTPIDTIARASGELRPTAVVLAALDPERFEAVANELRSLGESFPLMIGGQGAHQELGDRIGAEVLSPDPVGSALQLMATGRPSG
jgi:MerR family transcriptional regulator, light-induced transcriptional regulator